MIKRMMAKLLLAMVLLMSQSVFAGNGLLFNVTSTGTPANISITLCLNGAGQLSCQNYTVTGLNLSITTVPNHTYPSVGIKINTPGYTLGNLGLACTPNGSGYCLFSVSNTQAKAISLVVNGPLAISPSTLPAAMLNTTYNQSITASGGVAPYTYVITSGALPTGLSLSTSGVISGTPTADGTSSFTVTATDANTPTANTGSQVYSVVVTGSLVLSPSTLPTGTLNTAYTQMITANGGIGPYTYAVTSGTLPPGLVLNSSSGVISGTPTSDGTYPFTVTATDTNSSDTGSRAYSVVVTGSLVLSPSTLPAGTTGTAYNQTIAASGGIGPYTYAVTSGTLPTGLILDTNSGVISGTPTSAATYSFTVTATDTQSTDTGSQAYSIQIVAPPSTTLTESVSSLGLEASGNARTITLTNTGADTAFNVTYSPSPALPSGTTITPTNCGNIVSIGTCVLTIHPGATPSATAYNTSPTPITLSVQGTNTNTLTPTLNIVTFGSVYQSGFIYSIDDTTPSTGSIGGKVAAVTDQAAAYPNGIIWSSDGSGTTVSNIAIFGISETSTSASPNPSTGQIAGQSACNGKTDGSCDTTNIVTYYNANRTTGGAAPTPLTHYASGLCKASMGGYTDWYLPAICEMGPASNGSGCVSGTPNIVTNLPSLLTSCTGSSCLAGSYWSSTEYSGDPPSSAWSQYFASGGGSSQYNDGKYLHLGVRCSRALTL